LPVDQKNNIAFICGQKGCGKTFLAARLALSLYNAGRRVVCVAPMAGFKLPGCPVVRSSDIGFYYRYGAASLIVEPTEDRIAEVAFKYALDVGSLCLFVDEIDNYFSPHNPNPDLLRIIRYGRHFNLSLVGISQRPASVCKDLIAQADYKVIFRASEPNDLAYIRKWAGIEPERLQSLKKYQKIVLTAN